MAHVRGVIFDIDGTLVASNDAHAHAWVDALHAYGYAVDYAQVRELIGKGGDHLLPEVAQIESDSPIGKQIAQQRAELFKTHYLPTLQPTPGAHELVARLQADGIKAVVATSAEKGELDALLAVADVQHLLTQRASSDDAPSSKPDPDIIHVALEQLGLDPEEAIMIGDTPYDIEAAAKAGVRTIALRSGGWNNAALGEALAIYDHPTDLLAHLDELDLFAR